MILLTSMGVLKCFKAVIGTYLLFCQFIFFLLDVYIRLCNSHYIDPAHCFLEFTGILQGKRDLGVSFQATSGILLLL